MQQELAAAEEEKKRQLQAQRKAALAQRGKRNHRRGVGVVKDVLGMNSPKKSKVAEGRALRSLSTKVVNDTTKFQIPSKTSVANKCVGFGSSVPRTKHQQAQKKNRSTVSMIQTKLAKPATLEVFRTNPVEVSRTQP